MKTPCGVMGFSILSTMVAGFAITELCVKPSPGASSSDGVRAKSTETGAPNTSQKVRLWVNH